MPTRIETELICRDYTIASNKMTCDTIQGKRQCHIERFEGVKQECAEVEGDYIDTAEIVMERIKKDSQFSGLLSHSFNLCAVFSKKVSAGCASVKVYDMVCMPVRVAFGLTRHKIEALLENSFEYATMGGE
jgi:hypothetical protein